MTLQDDIDALATDVRMLAYTLSCMPIALGIIAMLFGELMFTIIGIWAIICGIVSICIIRSI